MTPKPLVAGWSFTNACNLRCRHCYNASGAARRDEMSLKDAFEAGRKLKEAGVAAINFGGGECALRPDFFELCSFLCSLGLKISYTTNGTHSETLLASTRLFHDIGVSIDFAHPSRHDELRRRTGTFAQATRTIRALVEQGVDTEMVTCLHHLNCGRQDLEALYRLAKSLGVRYWRLNRFRANGRGLTHRSALELSANELKSAYQFLSELVEPDTFVPDPLFRAAFGGNYSLPGDPSGWTAFRIQADGEVTPSVFLTLSGGNIQNQSVEQIMASPVFRMIRERRRHGKCRTCPAYEHCRGGDAGASYLAYGRFDGPDPLCWLDAASPKGRAEQRVPNEWNVHELYLCTVYVPLEETKKEFHKGNINAQQTAETRSERHQ